MSQALAVVTALGVERRALERALASTLRWWAEEFQAVSGRVAGQSVVLVQAGIGQERARRALLATGRWYRVGAALSLGLAGGLVDSLRPGDLVCPAVVLSDLGAMGPTTQTAPAQPAVRAALSAAGIASHEGPLLTSDVPFRTPEAKRAAHRRSGAVAVDMEAAGVAVAAAALGIPWLAIKAVVDPVEEPLPEFLAGCTTPRGDLSWRGLLALLLGGGERRRLLGRLARASRRAGRNLTRSLDVAARAGVALTAPPRSSSI